MGNRRKMRAAVMAFLLAGAVGLGAAEAPLTVQAAQAAQSESIPVYVRGERSSLSAEWIDGVPYLTLETIALLGGAVKKEKDGKTYTVSAGETQVRFTIGKTTRYENGSPAADAAAPVAKDGKVFVPAAWLAKPLGLKIVKDRLSASVYIFKQDAASERVPSASPPKHEADNTQNSAGGTNGSGAAGPDASGGSAIGTPPSRGSASPKAGGTEQSGGEVPGGGQEGDAADEAADSDAAGDAAAGDEEADSAQEEGSADGQRPAPSGMPNQAGAEPQQRETLLYSVPEEVLEDGKTALTKIVLKENTVRVETNGTISANIFSLSFPERLVIDLPGATVIRNENGKAAGQLEIDPFHPFIAGIRYSLYTQQPQLVRIVIDLKKRIPYASQLTENGAEVVLTEREPVIVAIDAGHGGHDPGAISASGRYEKEMTLPIAQKLYKLLQGEPLIRPLLIRGDDSYLSPAKRAAMANEAGADLFISIHANTAPVKSVRGTETYYWREESLPFAELVHEELVKTIGSPDRKVRQAKFVVVKDTVMPAVLLELGFISNTEDERKLLDARMQDKIAETIANAVKQYFDIPS